MIVDEEEEEMEDKPNQQQTYVSGNIMFIVFSFIIIVFRGGGEGEQFSGCKVLSQRLPSGNFPRVFS